MKSFAIPVALSALFVFGCASQRGVDFDESARLMGREGDVRLDAQISSKEVGVGTNVGLTFEVENLRKDPIAFADIIPEVTFDPDTGVVTVLLGSEVPGNEFLPRLELIRSGERKSFTTGTSLNVGSTARNRPRSIRIRLSYLKNVEPFEHLVGITQKAVRNPGMADELFLPWVENVQFVDTNSIPLNWTTRPAIPDSSSRTRPPGSRY